MSAPAVAVSQDGKKLVAAWKDLRTGRNDPHVYWAISDDPNSFEDAPIDFEPDAKQNHPSITLDRTGAVWAAWEDTRSKIQRIWARSSIGRDAGGPVSDPSEGEASFPSITANAGIVALVYETASRDGKSVRFRLISDKSRL